MEKRLLGRTGHSSTVVTFGAIVLGKSELPQKQLDGIVDLAINQYGINHIDIAPGYGNAMEALAPSIPKIRNKIFLGTKTAVKDQKGAWENIQSCLKRLKVSNVDLLQLHGISTMAQLDEVTMKNGALDAIIESRQKGITKWIGITGHGPEAPKVHLEALRRFDFDTIMFPMSPSIWRNKKYQMDSKKLLKHAKANNVGIQCIKMLARGGWGDSTPDCTTWYDPHRTQEEIDASLWWLLSQPIHTAPSTGEITVLPKILNSAERFYPLTKQEETQAINRQKTAIKEPRLGIIN